MKNKTNIVKRDKIYNKYKENIYVYPYEGAGQMYCIVKPYKTFVYCEPEVWENPTEEDLFDLLHEVGHAIANKPGMKRYEEEFYATVFAISKMEHYKLSLSNKRKKEWQNYINKYREGAIKRKAKNVMTLDEVTLVWN